jgi:hypothetical protein
MKMRLRETFQPDVLASIILGATMLITSAYHNTIEATRSSPAHLIPPAPMHVEAPPSPSHGMIPTGSLINGERVIRLKAFHFAFDPSTIIVKEGDRIRLEIVSTDDLILQIPVYHIEHPLTPYHEDTIRFVAGRSGTYSFSCLFGEYLKREFMRGKLIVLQEKKKRWNSRTAMRGIAAYMRDSAL